MISSITRSLGALFCVEIIFSATAPLAGAATTPAGTAATTTAAASASSFFDVTPHVDRPAAHTTAALNKIFLEGIGPYDSTMAGQIYPYPLTQGGQPGAPLYNGCYDQKLRRLSNLDADNSCTSAMAANAGKAVYRLFLGYKISCNGTPALGICPDTELLMNCQYQQVQIGNSPYENSAASERVCSAGVGIPRTAQGSSNSTPTFIGCYPGQDGTTYPVCSPCPSGTFNSTIGVNTNGCSPCNGNKIIPYAVASPSPPPIYTTPVGAKVGAIDPSQCTVDPASPRLQCISGYQPSGNNQTCVQKCTLALGVVPTNPDYGTSNGRISVTYSNAIGAMSALPQITSPSPMTAASSGGTYTFNNLGANTYTVSATDTVCTQTVAVTLTTLPPVCAISVSPGSASPPSAAGGTNGSFSVSTSGSQGTVTYSASPSASMGSSSNSGASWSGAASGSYTVTATDTGVPSCSSSTTVVVPGGAACNLTLFAGSSNAPSVAGGSDGNFSVNTAGATGTISYSVSPTATAGASSNSGASYSGASSQTYTVTANDSGVSGCSKSVAVTVPPAGTPACNLAVFAGAATAPTTSGGSDGKFAVNSAGAVGTLAFSASPSATLGSFTNNGASYSGASAQNYTVTATDSGVPGCSKSASVTVPSGSSPTCGLSLFAGTATSPSSAGGSDGAFSVNAAGAVGTLSYSTSPSATLASSSNGGASFTGAMSQTYAVTAIDSGVTGCSKSVNVVVPSTAAAMLVFNIHSETQCTAAGGSVYTDNSSGAPLKFCKYSMETTDPCSYGPVVFPDGSTTTSMTSSGGCSRYFIAAWTNCPTGWTKYKGWSAWSTDRKYARSWFMQIDYGGCLTSSGGPQNPKCTPGYFSVSPAVCTFPKDGQGLPFGDYGGICPSGTPSNWTCVNGYPQDMSRTQRDWESSTVTMPAATYSCPSGWNGPFGTVAGGPYYPAYPYYCTQNSCKADTSYIPSSQQGQWNYPVSTDVGCY